MLPNDIANLSKEDISKMFDRSYTIENNDPEYIKALIDCIGCISNVLIMHQVISLERMFDVCKIHNSNVTNSIFEKAIEICKKKMIINVINNGFIYETSSSLFKRKSIEEIIAITK